MHINTIDQLTDRARGGITQLLPDCRQLAQRARGLICAPANLERLGGIPQPRELILGRVKDKKVINVVGAGTPPAKLTSLTQDNTLQTTEFLCVLLRLFCKFLEGIVYRRAAEELVSVC